MPMELARLRKGVIPIGLTVAVSLAATTTTLGLDTLTLMLLGAVAFIMTARVLRSYGPTQRFGRLLIDRLLNPS